MKGIGPHILQQLRAASMHHSVPKKAFGFGLRHGNVLPKLILKGLVSWREPMRFGQPATKDRRLYVTPFGLNFLRGETREAKCDSCRVAPPEEGKQRCRECLDDIARAARKHRKKLSFAGICTLCGTDPSEPERTMCRPCNTKSAAKVSARHAKRHAAGICITCGKNPARPGTKPGRPNRVECQPCADYRKEHYDL